MGTFDFEPGQPRRVLKKRRKKSLIVPASIAVGGAILVGVIAVVATSSGGIGSTGEQQAVRSYLKENLPDPTWEEVRWWPSVDLGNGDRALRLKYRAKSFLGKVLVDQVFVFRGGRVAEVVPWSLAAGINSPSNSANYYAVHFGHFYGSAE